MASVIGELKGIKNDLEIEWRVPDFFSLSSVTDAKYRSPAFDYAGASWYFQMYPNGQTLNNTAGYVNCYFHRADSGDPIAITYEFGVKKRNGDIDEKCNFTGTYDEKHSAWGCAKFFLLSQLPDKKFELAPDNVVTFICRLKRNEPYDVLSPVRTRIQKLSQDLKDLMINGNGSDLSVKIKEKEFKLHKVIMGIRSPAFATMIKKEMEKHSVDIVEINDIEEAVFSIFLEYIYSGIINGDLLKKNVIGVYKIAEEYEILELKQECIKCIKNTISTDMFFDVVKLAERFDEKELKLFISLYCSGHLKDLVESPKWLIFMQESTKKAYELLSEALKVYVKSQNV